MKLFRQTEPPLRSVRIILVANNVSVYARGEDARPLHYFENLHSSGVDVHLVVHKRNREAILKSTGALKDRIHFTDDSFLMKALWFFGKHLPDRWYVVTISPVIHFATQARQKPVVRRLIAASRFSIVHEPTPISPTLPSLMFGLGVPVVVGPLNGAVDYPKPFRKREVFLTAQILHLVRLAAKPLNRIFPGRRNANVILVNNDRTAQALPYKAKGQIITLKPNAVDPKIWHYPRRRDEKHTVRFAFLGALVDFKAVDILLHAFRTVTDNLPATLDIIGDGPQANHLRKLSEDLQLNSVVNFHGRLDGKSLVECLGQADIFAFSSLREAGGAAVLEAMSLGLPVIAADWCGPSEFVSPDVGILVSPASPESFEKGFSEAMIVLARDPQRRRRMGEAARAKILTQYSWESRSCSLIEIYRKLSSGQGS